MIVTDKVKKLFMIKGLAEIFALLGTLWYLLQSIRFAHLQPAMLDEGTYLVKGYLFMTGQYVPFQANGPWTNQMPFSYLIPGLVEVLFGPGLRTGRYFSIALGLFMLLGLWLIADRFGGRWWAAGMVWMVAINPAFIRAYSLAVSQILIACIFVWVLFLALNDRNKTWKLMLASALAGFLIITRVNMAPVFPFLLVYIFWQFGLRAGLWSALSGLFVIGIGHALFWPGILTMWAAWIPEKLAPFLGPWRYSGSGRNVWNPAINTVDRIASLLDGVRFNFLPLLILIGFGILILQWKRWGNLFYYRTAVFLSLLMGFLVLIHGWASLLKNYCVYCFSGYLMFFSPIIMLLLVIVSVCWQPGPAKWYALFVMIVTLIATTAVGLGAFQEIGDRWIEMPVPLFLIGSVRGGTIPFWGILENGFGIPYTTSRWLVPAVSGFMFGVVLVVSVIIFIRFRQEKGLTMARHFGLVTMGMLLFVAWVLSPTRLFTGLDKTNPCEADIIASIEETGSYLADNIPDGSLVYWNGGPAAVPLLYIPKARIFPAQLNDVYSYREGGNPQDLMKYGLWNEILSEQWRQEADFIIILEKNYDQTWKQYLESGPYMELPRSISINPCEGNQRLRLFKRLDYSSGLLQY